MTAYSHVLLSKGCFYKRRYHCPNSSCSNQTAVILCSAKKYLTSAISFCLRKRKRKKETGNLKSCNVMKLNIKTVYYVLGFSHVLHSSLCEINNTTALQFEKTFFNPLHITVVKACNFQTDLEVAPKDPSYIRRPFSVPLA